jgi:hypothetical protein
MDGGEPDNRRLGNRRSVAGARRFRGERDRRGRWPDPGEILPGSFREAGRNLPGRFGDDSRWVRGRFGGGSGVRPDRRPRRRRRALRGASATGGDGGRILQGSWPEPSGTVRGRFEDGSRWVRGRFGGGSGVRPRRWPRRPRRAGRACQSAVGKPPFRCGSSSVSRRARAAGALADGPGRGVPWERGTRPFKQVQG